ncbi:mannosyl (alpha-1,3-)-glycoprotein beta-1,2-N-acetylglucosaminyltransferase [Perkinsus chesapeaki]|uniref:alpha-1,3-mannosyl-glycoprotein 2-beta-N-acetylglucosaminyltransferase n=1 Tax=Perkinsus chesapeaki TaxID=330153 RepID=A0A7J6MAV9_PERCH|nr:mannosyl (alpha-1,3-)-glycoprotein beta-1,2-N-acetylglucosaminyltransferase [Perkinsus chesapeaki]
MPPITRRTRKAPPGFRLLVIVLALCTLIETAVLWFGKPIASSALTGAEDRQQPSSHDELVRIRQELEREKGRSLRAEHEKENLKAKVASLTAELENLRRTTEAPVSEETPEHIENMRGMPVVFDYLRKAADDQEYSRAVTLVVDSVSSSVVLSIQQSAVAGTICDTNKVIILEEDMEIAPDFFNYFLSVLPLLQADPKLYCVSAWNDNGYESAVHDPRMIYRTDFFPGLGWMLTAELWNEIKGRWPNGYWDEFMRRPDVRKGRHCLRPEISRSYTFGEEGESKGQYFTSHLSRIMLNKEPVDFSSEPQLLSHLASEEAFDQWIENKVKMPLASQALKLSLQMRGCREVSLPAVEDILADRPEDYCIRIKYSDHM